MPEKVLIYEEDKQVVLDLLNEYQIVVPNIHFHIDESTYIGGIIGNDISKKVKDYFRYNRFIESINDLSSKTYYSIVESLNNYNKANAEKYNPLNNNLSEEEWLACYYLENALYREISLWDSLAQLYNLYFNLNIDVKKIGHKKVIEKLKDMKKTEINFNDIFNYIDEKIDRPSLDKGIHYQICELRNQMTHRYSITISSISDDTYLRVMPDTVYKIAKDFNLVHKYLIEIIDLILIKLDSENAVEEIKKMLHL